MESLYIVVPARRASTRLPDKPLALIGGEPMVRLVARRAVHLAQLCEGMFEKVHVLIATDDRQVKAACGEFEDRAVLSPAEISSGTDRVWWTLQNLKGPPKKEDLILNIQGDEPFFSLEDCLSLIQRMVEKPQDKMGTLARSRSDWDAFLNPGVVKAVLSSQKYALYFSRAPLPWPRSEFGGGGTECWAKVQEKVTEAKEIKETKETESTKETDGTKETTDAHLFWHHVGVYAFRYQSLCEFAKSLPQSGLEQTESLEQLRAVEAGWQIAVVEAFEEPFGVDTLADLERARARFRQPRPGL